MAPPVPPGRARPTLITLVIPLLLAACASAPQASTDTQSVPVAETAMGTSTAADTEGTADQEFPEVVDATVQQGDDGTWTAAVTLSSPYDTPERYADAWRVSTPDGQELVVRVLTHDHASEQPFTRSQSGFTIPEDLTTVVVEARDLVNGWGPSRLQVDVPR